MNDGPVAPSRCSRASGVAPWVARLAATSSAVSARWVWIGRSSFARVGDRALPRRVADRVRRVRRQREGEPRLVDELVADGEPLLQVAVRVGRVGRREVEHRQTEHRPHSGGEQRPRGGVGKEVHVVAAGDAAAQHLGGGEARAVEDEVRRGETAFARPDVLLEPHRQRHVVGDAAEQRHRRVRVGVDEPRDQRVPGQRDVLARRVGGIGRRRRQQTRRCARRRRRARDRRARPPVRPGRIHPASSRRSTVCMARVRSRPDYPAIGGWTRQEKSPARWRGSFRPKDRLSA